MSAGLGGSAWKTAKGDLIERSMVHAETIKDICAQLRKDFCKMRDCRMMRLTVVGKVAAKPLAELEADIVKLQS